jgi:hypothetical protein
VISLGIQSASFALVQVADFPKPATFIDLTLIHSLNWTLGRGEDGLGRHFAPPPPPPLHQGILLFCLILLSYLTSGVFSGGKLSLLKQRIFLILTLIRMTKDEKGLAFFKDFLL